MTDLVPHFDQPGEYWVRPEPWIPDAVDLAEFRIEAGFALEVDWLDWCFTDEVDKELHRQKLGL